MASYNKKIAGNEKVEFIHVSKDDSRKDATKWAKAAKFTWLTVLESKIRSTGMSKFDEDVVPQYYLISKEGKILAKGEDAAFAKIKKLTK